MKRVSVSYDEVMVMEQMMRKGINYVKDNYQKVLGATVVAGAAVVGADNATAQDFYNGCRGPDTFMMDSYGFTSDGDQNGLVVPKFFTRNYRESLPDLLIAAPVSYSEGGEVRLEGINVGWLAQNLLKEKVGLNLVAACGLFRGGDDNYNVFNPQIYLTKEFGKLSLDAEGSAPINLSDGGIGGNISGTVGYGITDRVRVGGSVIGGKGKKPTYQLGIRVGLQENNRSWLQFYAGKEKGGKGRAGIRFVKNFGRKTKRRGKK